MLTNVKEAFLQLTSILADPFHCGLFICILSAYTRVHYMICEILQLIF